MKNTPIPGLLHQKQPRIKLGAQDYDMMRERVLRRDSWRCQSCGSMKNLHIHHMKRRSQLGGDTMDNPTAAFTSQLASPLAKATLLRALVPAK